MRPDHDRKEIMIWELYYSVPLGTCFKPKPNHVYSSPYSIMFWRLWLWRIIDYFPQQSKSNDCQKQLQFSDFPRFRLGDGDKGFTLGHTVTFILFYLWAKYDPIWLDFTVQTLIFSAYYFSHLGWFLRTGRGERVWHTFFLVKKNVV